MRERRRQLLARGVEGETAPPAAQELRSRPIATADAPESPREPEPVRRAESASLDAEAFVETTSEELYPTPLHAIDCDMGEDCTCGAGCVYCADSGEVNELVDGQPRVLSCPECGAGRRRERFLQQVEAQQAASAALIVVPTSSALEPVVSKRYGPQDVLDAFLRRRSKNTLLAYKQDVDAFARWLGLTPAEAARLLLSDQATANDLTLRWLDAMQARGLSTATQARCVSTLKSLVRMGEHLGVAQWRITVQGPRVDPYRDTRGPGVEQLKKLFAVCADGLQGVRDRAILMIAATHALRRFEIAAMRVNDIDRKTGEPRLRVVGKGEKLVWITLTPESLAAVDEWLAAWRAKTAGLEQSDGPVFRSLSNRRWGEPLSPKSVYSIVTSIGRRAGVRVWPHGIRHTAITTFLDVTNGNLREGKNFARHSDPRTTERYDDARRDNVGEGARELGKLWSEKG